MDEMKITKQTQEDGGTTLTVDGVEYYRPPGWDAWSAQPSGLPVGETQQLLLDELVETATELPALHFPEHDVKDVQRTVAAALQADVDAADEPLSDDPSERYNLVDVEVALWIGIDQDDEAGVAAVTEALDLPWLDGDSLRVRFGGTLEDC